MTQLKMLTTDDKITEIRRLYFSTTRQTIEVDFAKALDLLKSMATEEERERATVFMEGLAEMRRDWQKPQKNPAAPKRGNPQSRSTERGPQQPPDTAAQKRRRGE